MTAFLDRAAAAENSRQKYSRDTTTRTARQPAPGPGSCLSRLSCPRHDVRAGGMPRRLGGGGKEDYVIVSLHDASGHATQVPAH